ncbi:MAG: hypothetical protein HOW73_14220 [Polyangiaceae bacterium]|nr:hypothetical protein [Polyangiaceae bacterium]
MNPWTVVLNGLLLVAALLRGFRLEISVRGMWFTRTLAGISLRRTLLSLETEIGLEEFDDDSTSAVLLSRGEAPPIEIGCTWTSRALRSAIVDAQEQWRQQRAKRHIYR